MNKEERENSKIYSKKNKFKFLKTFFIIVISVVITYFCTVTFTLKSYLNGSDTTYLATKVGLIQKKLEDTCIYDIDSDKMIESAVKGYVAGLGDKYTQYLTTEDMQSLLETTTGSFVGIGVYIVNNTASNTVLVVGVIEGSSAEHVGIQAGDVISKVNDIVYTGEQLDEASSALKGEEGTDVKVTVTRGSEQIDYHITRSSIKVKSVGANMINNIAYINIASFNSGTANEFKSAYRELQENNPKGLVIDLRNNGGGLVDESLKIAETMVEKGKVLLITSDKNKKEKIDKSNENPIINIPVVILINEYTASASEILAGTLRDNCNYKIIGKNSYGKGVIQNIYSFTDGSGLKVTSEEYFTPNHNVINNEGIKPDIEVDPMEEWKNFSNIPYEYDLQLQKAIEELN